jgi:hypothetical protein
MVLQGDKAEWMLTSLRLEIVPILMQVRCTVYAARTTGSEIILEAPNDTPRLCGSCGILFWSI